MKNKRYPNLHRLPYSPNWIYRKYSSQKKREFLCSTGIPAKDSTAAQAYKIGVERFNKWLGTHLPSGRAILMRDIFRAVLASKEQLKGGQHGSSYRSCKNQIEKHLSPNFGHLRPEQVNARMWREYDRIERNRGRNALFNTRKYMMEALHRAEEHGALQRVPELPKLDPRPAPPKYLDEKIVKQILDHRSARFSKDLYFLLWKQGPRPTEAAQYEWEMIHWKEGKHGTIHIPARISKNNRARVVPLNSEVSKMLKKRRRKRRRGERYIFPSRYVSGTYQKNYRKGFESACQDLGIDAVPYNLRDTFITNCLKRGLSPTFIGLYTDTSATMIQYKYAVGEYEALQEVAG
jgi:integrase